jgi:hypothetical protein
VAGVRACRGSIRGVLACRPAREGDEEEPRQANDPARRGPGRGRRADGAAGGDPRAPGGHASLSNHPQATRDDPQAANGDEAAIDQREATDIDWGAGIERGGGADGFDTRRRHRAEGSDASIGISSGIDDDPAADGEAFSTVRVDRFHSADATSTIERLGRRGVLTPPIRDGVDR